MEKEVRQDFVNTAYESWSRGDHEPLMEFTIRQADQLTPKEIAGILSLAVHIHSDRIDVSFPLMNGNEITMAIETILTPPKLLDL